jgi:hypothetical protein
VSLKAVKVFEVIAIGIRKVGLKVIPVLSDLDLELKSECKGSAGFEAIGNGYMG